MKKKKNKTSLSLKLPKEKTEKKMQKQKYLMLQQHMKNLKGLSMTNSSGLGFIKHNTKIS